MGITAADLLSTYGLSSLQQMARQRNLATPKNKEQAVKALAPGLFEPKAILASLSDLTSLERLLLDRLILAGGDTPTEVIRQQLKREGQTDGTAQPERGSSSSWSYGGRVKGSARNRGSRKFEDLVARLGALGLIFTAEPVHSGGYIVELNEPGRRLFIPKPILHQLPAAELSTMTAPPPSIVRKADPAPLLRDIYLLFSFALREPIPLTARGLIAKRSLIRIDSTLRHPEGTDGIRTEEDLARLPFLRALGEELGHLVAGPGELLLDERAEAFLRQPAGERQRHLFEAWRRTTRWNELFRIPRLSVKGTGMSVRTAPAGVVTARQRVLTELAELPAGEWITIEHVIERLRIRAYEFLLPRRKLPNSYDTYGYYGYGRGLPNPYRNNELGLTFEVVSEQAGWDLVEAELIRTIITEAFHTLGGVDLGEVNGETVAFRVTSEGAHLLRGETLATRPNEPHVIVQPNFQIIVMEPTGEDILFRLDQMADRLRVDQAVEYEITRDSVYRAQRAGVDAKAIVQFLESVIAVRLPQNVRRTIEEWGIQHERITVRQRTPLLQTLDEETLDGLYADPELAHLLGRRVASTVALVPDKALQPLFDRLMHLELLPALSEGPDDQAAPLLTIDSGGLVTFRQHLPSIYDLRPLRSFAETKNGTMRLNAESLRRGAKAGLSAEDILTTLERFHAGPLSGETTALIRRWAKDWGQGALIEATLLQVDHPDSLIDLLADPDVRTSLQPVPGAPTLALIRDNAVEHVRAVLNERGMILANHLIG
jgi:hypothetical protein